MHTKDLTPWSHAHEFAVADESNERRTLLVVIITAVTMVIEVAAGLLCNSMALLADGWHMGTHVAALAIAVFAYRYARRHARDPRFTFGTGKVGVLGGFASAMVLAVVALLVVAESIHRFSEKQEISFDEAILVAVLGLAVNVICALVLSRGGHQHHGVGGHDHGGHGHDHHNEHGHEHHEHGGHHNPDHECDPRPCFAFRATQGKPPTPDSRHSTPASGQHRDLNLRAAYLHVVADAFTSVLAIFALTVGKYTGHVWLDPAMGLVGGFMIARWSWGLIRDTGRILLDADVDERLVEAIRAAIQGEGEDRVADLHVWQVGPDRYAAIVSVVSRNPQPPEHYKQRLAGVEGLAHVSVEVHRCTDGG